MPNWEVCHIKNQYSSKGAFSKQIFQYVAVVDTAAGEKTIDKTIEFDAEKGRSQKVDDERAKLVSRLLGSGWEPIQADQAGQVSVFRRQLSI